MSAGTLDFRRSISIVNFSSNFYLEALPSESCWRNQQPRFHLGWWYNVVRSPVSIVSPISSVCQGTDSRAAWEARDMTAIAATTPCRSENFWGVDHPKSLELLHPKTPKGLGFVWHKLFVICKKSKHIFGCCFHQSWFYRQKLRRHLWWLCLDLTNCWHCNIEESSLANKKSPKGANIWACPWTPPKKLSDKGACLGFVLLHISRVPKVLKFQRSHICGVFSWRPVGYLVLVSYQPQKDLETIFQHHPLLPPKIRDWLANISLSKQQGLSFLDPELPEASRPRLTNKWGNIPKWPCGTLIR